MKNVPLKKESGEFFDKEKKQMVAYTNYFIVVNGINIKVKIDQVGKQLVDAYLTDNK